MLRSRALVLSSILVACASAAHTDGPKGDVAPTLPEEAADASVDVVPEAEAPAAAIDVEGCTVKRVADPDTCAEPCDARLTLSAGAGTYCTLQCSKDADCGGQLVCPDTVGACMPRCTSDASCKAAGFARCDAKTGACDTI